METACDICGCTQTNLVDGYYYCAECGTQDTNVRETIVEVMSLGEGICAFGTRKRITQIPQANKEQMTDDWYKWHSLNFLLRGLAGELVELGAAPSFKTKLLWVWTRYMKKYQNKADFGLAPSEEDEKIENEEKINDEEYNKDDENPDMNENYFSFGEEEFTKKNMKRERLNIKKINMPLVITLLYVALNLDKSHIQLTHLIRFINEGRLSLYWQKFVPKEMYPKKLKFCLLFNRNSLKYSHRNILELAMQLFRELDLGNPIVPDLRVLVDEYMQELCLPNDMKPLVLSLMHYRSFDYLDINVKFYNAGRIPSYELYVVSHILCAMKICFGLDGEYETELSEAVEKINELENHPKSYDSEPTERLFSFREWCNYIQFRKSQLWTHSLYLGAPHYSDMNDHVAFEHLGEKPDFKKTLKDEITRDIINKLPEVDINVIPKSEFPATTTPHTTYTRVIIEHQQDPVIKQLLREDFTQYSLKYITEDMFLVDPDSINPKNIITGVNTRHLKEIGKSFPSYENFKSFSFSKKFVYVRDCDNHNWMTTQRPKLEHVATTSEIDENENYDSKENSVLTDEVVEELNSLTHNGDDEKYESDSKETIVLDDSKVFNDLNNILEMEIEKEKHNEDLLKIPEEDENENIFDDNFKGLDTKEEENDTEHIETDEPMPEMPFQVPDIFRHNGLNQEYRTGRDSDESSEDSIRLNPETFDRNKAIKELVIHACNKYKVSIPGIYICHPKRNYVKRKKYDKNVERAKVLGLTTEKINGLIEDYHNKIKQDIFIQMSNMVQSAITDFNESKDIETPMDIDEPPNDNTACLDSQNDNNIGEVQTINGTLDPDLDKTDKYNLFDENSDGETHAEELLPKKNPEFDEETHDISQLYIKQTDDASAPEMTLDPNLYKIIDKNIEDIKDGNPPSPDLNNSSDSEEDMSLSMLQDLKLLRDQLTSQAQRTQAKKLKPLLKETIPPYKYWVRHYSRTMHSSSCYIQSFSTEIDDVFPSTFKIVMNELADVVGYPTYFLYAGLQRVESCIKDKYVCGKRFGPGYLEKEKRRFMNSRDML